MKWGKTLRRWTMRSIHATLLGSALLGSASLVFAQPPSATASKIPEPHITRGQSFDLPVRIEQDLRSSLSEIRLYVKTPGSNWKLQESGPANLTRFSCKVTQDGEYWYSLATVDNMGRMTPADVNLEAPSQRVLIDTTAPVIQVQSHTIDGDFCLRCVVQDANPDPASLKAVCQTDSGDLPLETVPNQPGVFRVKGGELMRFPVIVSVKDLAGNIGTKAVNVREMIGSTLSPMPAPKGQVEIAQTSLRPDQKLEPKYVAPLPPDLPPTRTDLPPRTDVPPVTKNEGPVTKLDFPPMPLPSSQPLPNPLATSNPIENTNVTPKLPMASPTPETPNPLTGPLQLINTTHASVEYRIDQVGASGVGKVEVFMTPDRGQSWHRLGEDADKRSPAEINLPGDGAFGIRIVVTNGNGFGGRAPVRGDAPHCTIEVDSTSPFVQLRSTEVLPSSGHVELRWNATDKNLAAEPVSLFYRTRPDTPWQVIVRGVKNDGLHRWAFPRDAGAHFFFKIEVADMAGNLAQDVSRQPVVIDMTEPRATVLGVTSSATTPRANGSEK